MAESQSKLLSQADLQAILDAINGTNIRLDDLEAKLDSGAALVDIIDRWPRELGQVDLARVLGAALSPINPVITGIFDALGNRMPTMDAVARAGYMDVIDRAARLVGIIYGDQGQLAQRAATRDAYVQLRTAGVEYDARQIRALTVADVVTVTPQAASVWDVSDRWARQLGLVDISRVLGAALSVTNPVITGIYDAAGNRMPSMDAVARPGYVDVIDRVGRAVGVVSQTTRTSMTVKPEREDLTQFHTTVAPAGAADTVILAAVAGQSHKIFSCGYETDAAVRVRFRFGVGNLGWGARRTAGVYAQTFTQPQVGPVNTALNFRSEGAVNADVWAQFVTEP